MMESSEGVRFFIPGLPPTVGDEEVGAHFRRYGNVLDAGVAKDRATGLSRGFGYVTMDGSINPDTILNDNHSIGGQEVQVRLTKESLAGTDNKKVFIANANHLSPDEIRDAFMGFGQVWDVHTPKDPHTGMRKDFAFVTFAAEDSYERAVTLGWLEVKGANVEIKPATQNGGKGKCKGCGAFGWDGGKGCGAWGCGGGGCWGKGCGGGDCGGGCWGKGGGGCSCGGKGAGFCNSGPMGKPASMPALPSVPADGVTYFISRIPDMCQEADLMSHFSRYGNVKAVNIDRGNAAGTRARVTLEDASQRDAILSDTHTVCGANLSVLLSKEYLMGEGVHKVHLDNCQNFSPEAIRECFSQFGPILDVHAPRDLWSGERKRFAFVTYASEEAMNRAIAAGSVYVYGEQVTIQAATRSDGEGGKGKGKGKNSWEPWGKGGGASWGGDSWGSGGKS
eukprot:CAMPEP_0176055616 /NCGR_PEP_ID=MMETSP0120_2-20121206/27690_1 /TAXON_ID=160619 /ORGANISM="Kryptoperidinium foliaceum, Strain CCMP 1326" /LENGTH=448 /DNA_ID=CAMNT_0017389113 /DNA_START=68 /DNA_END=1411 /DNA_ORIENTATION=+